MKKVDVPQVLISTAAIFGIGLLWYDFNVKVFNTVRDLLYATFYYMEESVLLGTKPLVESIRHSIRVVFSV